MLPSHLFGLLPPAEDNIEVSLRCEAKNKTESTVQPQPTEEDILTHMAVPTTDYIKVEPNLRKVQSVFIRDCIM